MTSYALQPGSALDELRIAPVSRTSLALFAGGSGDHHPIHLDLDVARGAGLDDVFAHGMLSMAYLARLLTDSFPLASLRSYRTRFTAVTPVGARPTCRGVVRTVERAAPHPGSGSIAVIDLTVTLADGTVTLAGEATVALP